MPDQTHTEAERTGQNIGAVLDFYASEDLKISDWQRRLEKISSFIGQPLFFGLILLFVLLWVLAITVLRSLQVPVFDPPPYHWLQGLLALAALLATVVVVSKQNRLGRLEEQRAHLDLKVNLLTEQKVAKLIDLIEELRRDLPDVRNRQDPAAQALQQPMNPAGVRAALDERGDSAPAASP